MYKLSHDLDTGSTGSGPSVNILQKLQILGTELYEDLVVIVIKILKHRKIKNILLKGVGIKILWGRRRDNHTNNDTSSATVAGPYFVLFQVSGPCKLWCFD